MAATTVEAITSKVTSLQDKTSSVFNIQCHVTSSDSSYPKYLFMLEAGCNYCNSVLREEGSAISNEASGDCGRLCDL